MRPVLRLVTRVLPANGCSVSSDVDDDEESSARKSKWVFKQQGEPIMNARIWEGLVSPNHTQSEVDHQMRVIWWIHCIVISSIRSCNPHSNVAWSALPEVNEIALSGPILLCEPRKSISISGTRGLNNLDQTTKHTHIFTLVQLVLIYSNNLITSYTDLTIDGECLRSNELESDNTLKYLHESALGGRPGRRVFGLLSFPSPLSDELSLSSHDALRLPRTTSWSWKYRTLAFIQPKTSHLLPDPCTHHARPRWYAHENSSARHMNNAAVSGYRFRPLSQNSLYALIYYLSEQHGDWLSPTIYSPPHMQPICFSPNACWNTSSIREQQWLFHPCC